MQIPRAHDRGEGAFAKLLRMDHEGIEPAGREAAVRAELERIGDRFAAWRGAPEQDQIS